MKYFQDLIRNIGRYATCFGLLKMPKLEELKYKTIEHFTDSDYDIRNGNHCHYRYFK